VVWRTFCFLHSCGRGAGLALLRHSTAGTTIPAPLQPSFKILSLPFPPPIKSICRSTPQSPPYPCLKNFASTVEQQVSESCVHKRVLLLNVIKRNTRDGTDFRPCHGVPDFLLPIFPCDRFGNRPTKSGYVSHPLGTLPRTPSFFDSPCKTSASGLSHTVFAPCPLFVLRPSVTSWVQRVYTPWNSPVRSPFSPLVETVLSAV